MESCLVWEKYDTKTLFLSPTIASQKNGFWLECLSEALVL